MRMNVLNGLCVNAFYFAVISLNLNLLLQSQAADEQ